MRRTPSVDALLPALYLKGISTGDFTEALAPILGEKASGLSATNIVRLKAGWEADYKAWSQRDLSQKRYVYWWADGVYFIIVRACGAVSIREQRISPLLFRLATPASHLILAKNLPSTGLTRSGSLGLST